MIVQADKYNRSLRHAIVAEVTTNLAGASDPASLLIEIATPEGQATGLKTDSLVTCLHLVTMTEERIKQVIGTHATIIPNANAASRAPVGYDPWP